MYKKVNKITETHLRVLSLFTRYPDSDYYIREVQKKLQISPRTAQLILENLEKRGILEARTRGKIKTYQLKNTYIAKEYLLLAEQYKRITFFESKPLIREIIEKIDLYINGIACVFGSYAKGIAKKDSDLDIFIAGSCNREQINKIEKLYGIEINIKNYQSKTFTTKLLKDHLLKEILTDHICIKETENFVGEVMRGYPSLTVK